VVQTNEELIEAIRDGLFALRNAERLAFPSDTEINTDMLSCVQGVSERLGIHARILLDRINRDSDQVIDLAIDRFRAELAKDDSVTCEQPVL
jgi:hypothetical protein